MQVVIHGPHRLRGVPGISAAKVVAELGWSSRIASTRSF
jgi:hypothetical protein